MSFSDVDSWSKLNLTESEKEWLENHPVIRVGPEDDYAPIEYKVGDEFVGLSMDYLKWMEEEYGLKFEMIYYKTWPELLEALRNDEIDLQTAIVKTPERSEYVTFTKPYINVPNVVLIRKDFDVEISMDNIFDYRTGLIGGYSVHEYIKLVYAPDQVFEYIDVREALSSLALGQLDILILDLGQASYYIQEMGITNVTIYNDVDIDFDYKLTFGAPKESKELISIMNKIMDTMPKEVKQDYYDKWINFGQFMNISDEVLRIIIFGIGSVIALLLMIAGWNFNLRRVVKHRTEALETLTKELELRVKERTKSLEAANEKIVESEKLNSLSRLVVGIAHEINTPLGNSVMLSSYMDEIIDSEREHLSSSSFEQLKMAREKLDVNMEKLIKLIENFKSVATYNYEQSFKVFNLSEEVDTIVHALEASPGCRELNYQLDIEAGIVVYSSRVSFYNLLSELSMNAYYHGYDGTAGTLDIKLYEKEHQVILEVRDYGRGMEEDRLLKGFEPFYTTKHSDKHIGLGLYSVYNLVTGILNGEIFVESDFGEGTRFKVVFEKGNAKHEGHDPLVQLK